MLAAEVRDQTLRWCSSIQHIKRRALRLILLFRQLFFLNCKWLYRTDCQKILEMAMLHIFTWIAWWNKELSSCFSFQRFLFWESRWIFRLHVKSRFTFVRTNGFENNVTDVVTWKGFTGSGYSCTDIDECLVNNGGCSMSPRVECINTPGSRTCGACPMGKLIILYTIFCVHLYQQVDLMSLLTTYHVCNF